jgi:hypothetical protein
MRSQGFPEALSGPMAWKADELEEQDYVFRLSDNDIREIERALAGFKGTCQPAHSFGLSGD